MLSAVLICMNCRILSVRELRSLLSMLSDLPIQLKHVESFQGILQSCDEAYNGTRPSVEPIEYETHYDPDMVSQETSLFTKIISGLHSNNNL